jgi:integrase
MGERTRKANGDSWISDKPDKDGYWNAFVTMGTTPDGAPDRRHRKRRKRTDLRRAVKELERKRDAGVTGKGKLPTVSQLLGRRLKILQTRGLAPQTIRSYKSVVRNGINPRLGGQKIDRLLPEHIEDAWAGMIESGLGPASVRKAHVILSSALEVEFRRGNIGRNPCALVEPPELPESRRISLNEDQARRVIRSALKRAGGVRWALGLLTGMRQGEILGSEWEQLNEKRSELKVWHQLQRNTWRHGCADKSPDLAKAKDEKEREQTRARIEHACAAKHCNSWSCPKKPRKGKCPRHSGNCPPPCPPDCVSHARLCPQRALPAGSVPLSGALVLRQVKEKRSKTVPLSEPLMLKIREHRDKQYEQKLLAADEWTEHGLMFCRWNGEPIDPRADSEEWAEILEEAGIPHLPQHTGRHTAATIMLEKGVELAVTQEILGHSDIRVTRGYVHVSTPLAKRAADRMGDLLSEPPQSENATGTATPEEDSGS